MKYAIVGAGAMGAVLGGSLAKAGQEVWFVDPFEEHMDAINDNGLNMSIGDEKVNVKVNAVTRPELVGKADVIILMVKGIFTRSAISSLKTLAKEDSYIVTLQNGYGNVDILKEYFSEEQILYGIVQFGASLVKPGEVSTLIQPGQGVIIGSVTKTITSTLEKIVQQLQDGGLKAECQEDVDIAVWRKLGMNCGNNAACGLTRIALGPFMEQELGYDVAKLIWKEIVDVANAKGINISLDIFTNIGSIEKGHHMYSHLPSTAQDIKLKKPTEIEFLNGAIYREGQKLGIPTPYNEMIYKLTKIMENAYDDQF